MGTPVDPLLVLLPVLEEQRGRTDSREGNFVDLDQILTGAPGLEGLREVLRSTLGCVCTKQGASEPPPPWLRRLFQRPQL